MRNLCAAPQKNNGRTRLPPAGIAQIPDQTLRKKQAEKKRSVTVKWMVKQFPQKNLPMNFLCSAFAKRRENFVDKLYNPS
jgi:polysaccharide deacetylase 2 family uncharacterized protein YibQ